MTTKPQMATKKLTPIETALEYGFPLVGHLAAGALAGALAGMLVAFLPAVFTGNDDAAFALMRSLAIFGAGAGGAVWYCRRWPK